MKKKIVLIPQRICETMSGNLAYTVGRLAFRPGRPMLVEHVGGIYLEHDMSGRTLTWGYGPDYDLMHLGEEDCECSDAGDHSASLQDGPVPDGAVADKRHH